MLSVIIPAYNEEKMIARAAEVIAGLLDANGISRELIFVNDGSKDATWECICKLHEADPGIRGISFSRNFGKEAAVFAGLTECEGDCAVVIDCDLQHPPEKILDMYALWEEGYEIVEGVKADRGKESLAHGFAARCFYRMISNATGIDMSNASDFKLLDRKVVNALINMTERDAFFRALSSWVGFKATQITYDVREREAGESAWTAKSLILYAISNITSYTSVPLQIVTMLGILMLILGVVISVQSLYKWFAGSALEGFTTVIILQCFSSSFIMISLGIIGYYISKIYEGVQGRPRYIVSERTE
ncbi:MAG: glycosyltransferase family 2 protein [Lachnospiraceae bacterium]|nr:glycosyltransferase family 2 protein [Lachnospiraceae bacterium]